MESWGRFPKAQCRVVPFDWINEVLPEDGDPWLPFGLGRSYGDSCLNDQGSLLDTSRMNRFISFDPRRGVVRCEAGVSLQQLLEVCVPKGWFPPVLPGTQFVTVGGAIANDVHGKNHHRSGSFGAHVLRLGLLRSDLGRVVCSPAEDPALFSATIGGLGLTGLILWAEIQLRRVTSSWIIGETVKFGSLEEFFSVSSESDREFEYSVAWVDCFARKASLGRGLLFRGNHAAAEVTELRGLREKKRMSMSVPFDLPSSFLRPFSLQIFNSVYYRSHFRKVNRWMQHYSPFFFPLDSIEHWNRLYGAEGLLQYQCVVPEEPEGGGGAIREVIEAFSNARKGSFLAVLKKFGTYPSMGLLSFPRPGYTLALDFSARDREVFELLKRVDEIVMRANGAVYPAKDARMSAEAFRTYYPRWQELQKAMDPRFSSNFWRRVTG